MSSESAWRMAARSWSVVVVPAGRSCRTGGWVRLAGPVIGCPSDVAWLSQHFLGQMAVQGRAAHPGQAQQLADVGSLIWREAQREPQLLVRAGWAGRDSRSKTRQQG